jgi:FtsZ-interacting cell division protein ZipA
MDELTEKPTSAAVSPMRMWCVLVSVVLLVVLFLVFLWRRRSRKASLS